MSQATITVLEVKEPKVPRGPGSVKDSDGNYWKCWPNELGLFEEGGVYTVEYTEGEYKGRPENTVKTAKLVKKAGPKKAAAGGGKYGATDIATAERIFVCGALNAILGSHNVSPMEMSVEEFVGVVNDLRKTWANTFGGNPQKSDDMNDELPDSYR